jgi:nitrous oxidase accessory protein NosD
MKTRPKFALAALVIFASPGSFAAIYDVRTYGASPTIPDSCPAIQAAINAAQTAGGGAVYVPESYVCTSSLLISGSAVRLFGDTDRSRILFQNASGISDAILLSGATGVEISGLRLAGSTTTPTVSRLITISGGSDIAIRNNLLSGANRSPASGATGAVVVLGAGSTNIRIEGNQLFGNGQTSVVKGYDIVNWSGAVSSQISVTNNRVTGGNTEISIAMFDTAHVRIAGNYIDQNNKTAGGNNDGYGILLYDATTPVGPAEISSNTVRNSAGSGIYIAGGSSNDRDISIHDNYLLDVAKQQNDASLPVGGISINGVQQVLIHGNRIDLSGKNGIELSTVNIASVNDNLATSAGRYGIRLRGAVTATSLTNNMLAGNTSGAYSLSGSNGTYVSANRVSGGLPQGVATLASGTVTVATTEIQAGDQILLTRQSFSGAAGVLAARSIVTGTSFAIDSTAAGDSGTVFWQIVH